jgi:hypothetical protein
MSAHHHQHHDSTTLGDVLRENKWVLMWIAIIVTLILLVNTYDVFFKR